MQRVGFTLEEIAAQLARLPTRARTHRRRLAEDVAHLAAAWTSASPSCSGCATASTSAYGGRLSPRPQHVQPWRPIASAAAPGPRRWLGDELQAEDHYLPASPAAAGWGEGQHGLQQTLHGGLDTGRDLGQVGSQNGICSCIAGLASSPAARRGSPVWLDLIVARDEAAPWKRPLSTLVWSGACRQCVQQLLASAGAQPLPSEQPRVQVGQFALENAEPEWMLCVSHSIFTRSWP